LSACLRQRVHVAGCMRERWCRWDTASVGPNVRFPGAICHHASHLVCQWRAHSTHGYAWTQANQACPAPGWLIRTFARTCACMRAYAHTPTSPGPRCPRGLLAQLEGQDNELQVEVWDQDMGPDDSVGSGAVNLAPVRGLMQQQVQARGARRGAGSPSFVPPMCVVEPHAARAICCCCPSHSLCAARGRGAGPG
jgi:hypothetical protein